MQAKGFSGAGHAIAILDPGVDKTHPMLAGTVAGEACYSTNNTTAGATSLCPGHVSSSTNPGSGVNCPTTIDGCEHGTHVASIAAGRQVTTSGKTLTGVGRGAKIVAVQVFTRLSKGCGSEPAPCVRSYETDQVLALHHLYQVRNTLKIIAINMSLGSGKFASACDSSASALATEISNLRAAGIATTIAAGNNGYDGFISEPACISTAVAVGNSNSLDIARSTSNNSTLVKVMAPGAVILGAAPGNHYKSLSGTSQAAPYVAGAIALMKKAKPTATMASILTGLECGGKMITMREVPGGDPKFLLPPRPRVDLLMTLDFLKYSATALREWDFSAAAQAFDWTPFRGAWKVAGGSYQQTPPRLGWTATSVATCDQPSTVTMSMIADDPVGVEPGWFAGIILRANISYKTNTVAGYFLAYDRCHANSGGSCTGLPSDPRGQAVVYRLDNPNFSTGSGGLDHALCRRRVAIPANTLATLKAVSSGAHFSYYLNGGLICSFSDSTYSTGRDMIAIFNNSDKASAMAAASFSVKFANTSASSAEPQMSPVMDPSAYAPKPALSGLASGRPAG